MKFRVSIPNLHEEIIHRRVAYGKTTQFRGKDGQKIRPHHYSARLGRCASVVVYYSLAKYRVVSNLTDIPITPNGISTPFGEVADIRVGRVDCSCIGKTKQRRTAAWPPQKKQLHVGLGTKR
uniref:Uncharacterized protein n=1 Tax=Candidatus Kentrum sp. TUN TaxID=2126343 RepID=A0A451A098_9GAMM|nr:MAG: hypothetical protein BECKTUN1418D_GA0071000_11026 [Candidatus Kentron sp. TUN]